MPHAFWLAVALHVGTTIGAGIFAIPFVTAKAGYPIGLLWLLVLTIFVIASNIAYASVILREKGATLQLAGYAAKYITPRIKPVTAVFVLFGYWGSLLAYTIGMGRFMSILVGVPMLEVPFSVLSVMFVVVALSFNLKLLAKIEGSLTIGMLIAILGLIVVGLPYIRIENLTTVASIPTQRDLIAPYGVMMNALLGYSVIPEMARVLNQARLKPRYLYLSVTLGTLIAAVVYLFFQLMVTGVSGSMTSDEAIRGLLPFLPAWVVWLGAFFGALAIITSFLTIAYATKDMFIFDFGYSERNSVVATMTVPVILYIVGLQSFVAVLEFGGAWSGTFVILLICLMYFKVFFAKQRGKNTPFRK